MLRGATGSKVASVSNTCNVYSLEKSRGTISVDASHQANGALKLVNKASTGKGSSRVERVSSRRAMWRRAIFAVASFAALCSSSSVAVVEDRFASDPELRRFVDSQHGEAIAIELGRLVYRKRWNEVLDQSMYLIAPHGTWSESHPAWMPARRIIAQALLEESSRWLGTHRDEVRLVVNEQSMQVMTPEERRQTTEFFESSAGRVFLATRETFLREQAYGLPLEIEKEPLETFKRAHDGAQKVLLALPEDGDGKVIYDFFHGGPGDKLLHELQVEHWGRIVANVFSGDLEAFVSEHKAELSAKVRGAVTGIPPASDKTYLGSVAMASDRTFTVIVEHYVSLSLVGKYTLSYAPADLHWSDIAAAAPGIKPGETRALYRDRAGRLGDRP